MHGTVDCWSSYKCEIANSKLLLADC